MGCGGQPSQRWRWRRAGFACILALLLVAAFWTAPSVKTTSPLSCSNASNLQATTQTDHFFEERPCPERPIDVQAVSTWRTSLVPDCFGAEPSVSEQRVNITWIPSLPFGQPCLKKLLLKFCSDHEHQVPSIVHHVWFGPTEFRFQNLLSFLSVKFQRPCFHLIHSDVLPSGHLWQYFLQLQPRVLHVQRQRPREIFGHAIQHVEHMSDVARMEALLEHGGIYMDTDTVLVRSLDSFRLFPVTLSYENSFSLSNSLIVAAPGAKFLQMWKETYRTFNGSKWGEHSVLKPLELARKHPDLVHTVWKKFVGGEGYFFATDYDWSQDFAIHLYTRRDNRVYNTANVLPLKTAVGSVARHVLYGRRKTC